MIGLTGRDYSLGQLVLCDKSTLAMPIILGKIFEGISHLFMNNTSMLFLLLAL